MRAVIAGLTALAVSLAAPTAAPAPAPRLERVVLVIRHGVRPPTADNAALGQLSAQPWPAWPVAPGELTPHGAQVVSRVAAGLRSAYAADGLLPAAGCPPIGAVRVWADGADQRTRASGEAFVQGFAPGCGLASLSGPAGARDPLFAGADPGVCPIDPALAEAAVRRAAGPGGLRTAAADAALKRLQAIVAPEGCAGGKGVCLGGEDRLEAGRKGVKLTGPLATGASLSEDLLLEYAEGLRPGEVGWGRASAPDIAAVLPAHERYAAVTRAAPYLAARRGGVMAGEVVRLLRGGGAAPRMTVLVGHDTNLSALQGVFGLRWRLPGQPDSTAPATALAFELWRRADGAEDVRVRVFYLPLEQMRTLKPGALGQARPTVGACAGAGCSVARLTARLDRQVPADCRR